MTRLNSVILRHSRCLADGTLLARTPPRPLPPGLPGSRFFLAYMKRGSRAAVDRESPVFKMSRYQFVASIEAKPRAEREAPGY